MHLSTENNIQSVVHVTAIKKANLNILCKKEDLSIHKYFILLLIGAMHRYSIESFSTTYLFTFSEQIAKVG